MSDLEQILSGETPEPEAPQEAAPEAETAPEVEASAPTPEEAPTPVETAQPEPTVPLSALMEVRKELQEMKAGMPRPEAPKAPDVFEDPQGFAGHLSRQVQSAQLTTKLETSRFMAEREFGKDTVDKAFQFFNERPEQSQALLSHASPFHAAVEEYNKHAIAQEIGQDPAAYRAKIEAEVRAKVQAEMVAEQAKAKASQPAPTMANVAGTGGGPKTAWAGPTSLESLLGS